MANDSNAKKFIQQNKGVMNDNARKTSPSFNIGGNHYRNNQAPVSTGQAIKNQVKRKVIKEGIKKGAQAYGVPEGATEKILESETGREVLDAASSAQTPTEGARRIAGIVTRKALISALPAIIGPIFLLLIIIAVIFGTNVGAGTGYGNDNFNELLQEISSVKSNYKYKADIDGNLILATLLAYNSTDNFVTEGADDTNMANLKRQVSKLASYQVITNKSCTNNSSTLRNIASNDDLFGEANYNCIPGMNGVTYTLSTAKGEPDNDNSGSAFYWNLIDEDFIFNYYNKYMINKNENTSENDEKINAIIDTIYSYYKLLGDVTYDNRGICSNGITIDGMTMKFEDYVKGAVYALTINTNMSQEAMQALAVVVRSKALEESENCTRELHSNTEGIAYLDGANNDANVINAVSKTSGEYLSLNEEAFNTIYTNFPDVSSDCNVVCNEQYCSADIHYDKNKNLGTHKVTVPRRINGIDVANDGKGSCVGISMEALMSTSGKTYQEILEEHFSNMVTMERIAGEGLVKDKNGYLKRVERANRDNLYYYSNFNDYDNGYISGGLEGECAWYAVKRTNEIISTMGLSDEYDFVSSGGNGRDFCYARDYKQFEKSTNPNNPNLESGAIISWYDNTYGHVAVVEAVYRNGNGDITSIDISEAGISFGKYGRNARLVINSASNNRLKREENCEGNGSGCQHFRNITMSNIKNLNGRQKFICYLQIVK